MREVRRTTQIDLTHAIGQWWEEWGCMGFAGLTGLALVMGSIAISKGNQSGWGMIGLGVVIGAVAVLLVNNQLVLGLGIVAGLSPIYLLIGGGQIEQKFPFLPWVWIAAVMTALSMYVGNARANPEINRLLATVNQKLDTPANRKAKQKWELGRHDPQRNAEQQDGWQALRAGTWIAGLLLLPVGGASAFFGAGGAIRSKAKERAWQHGARSATELAQLDSRAPVLFLRSFADDTLQVMSFPDVQRLESIVVDVLSLAGPVIAIGRPEDRLAPVGAARDYVGIGWKREVLAWMGCARVIVSVVGTTPGLVWELENLRRTGILHRVVFVVPPLPPAQLEPRWKEFAEHAAEFLALPAVADVDPLRTLVFTIDADDRLMVLTLSKRTPQAYQLALHIATASKLD